MKPEAYDIADKARRFGRLLYWHPLACVASSLLVFFVLYAKIAIDEFAAKTRDDILVLACEMINERGPNFIDALHRHETNLTECIDYTTGSLLTRFLCSLPGIENPRDPLSDALQILRKAGGGDREAARAVWLAGETLMHSRVHLPVTQSRITLHSNEVASARLRDVTEKAIRKSEMALEEFEKCQHLRMR